MKYYYVIDLNERSYYNAHVEDEKGNIIEDITNEFYDEETEEYSYPGVWLVEDGYMKNLQDMDGLFKFLVSTGQLNSDDELIFRG